MMPFSPTIRERALLACKRRCCLCEEHVHTLVECHHIVQEADGGDNSFDNCIPLCLNCHGRVASYNPRHPIGNQYSEKELKQRRNNFYAQMNPDHSGRFPHRPELEPPIDYKGFSIEEEHGLFAVRFYQKNPDLMHDFKPWCDSVEEAKAVVDKLVARTAEEDTGSNL
jgi:hypothetical protein